VVAGYGWCGRGFAMRARGLGAKIVITEVDAIKALEAVADVTERTRAVAALREADQRKDEFLATLAHELRNPLAPVRNAVQILKLKAPPIPEVDWARGVIDRQIRQMTRLVDDLLDLSRITQNRVALRRERFELKLAVQEAVETSAPLIAEAGHRLDITVPDEPIWLDADLTRLSQVFANLLNNAAKYTDRGGQITLTASRAGDEAVVTVRDNGVGIPAGQLPHIFEMFTQVDRTLERSQSGLGIGLALVRGLVELHGGTLGARSDGPGLGSEFTVRLPIATGPRPIPPPGWRSSGAHAAVGRRIRILIVDDNKDGADSLDAILTLQANEVRTVYDGASALEAAAAFEPEIVLLDLGMPRLDGYETCRRIRATTWGKDAVVIAVTGWSMPRDRGRTKEAGFDDHLVKPVDPAMLMELIAALTAAKRR